MLQLETKDFEIATINLLKELKERMAILKEQMAKLSEEIEVILYLESTDRTLGGKEKRSVKRLNDLQDSSNRITVKLKFQK